MIGTPTFVCLTGRASEPSHLNLSPGQTCVHAPSATFLREDRGSQLHAGLSKAVSLHLAPGAPIAQCRVVVEGPGITCWVAFVGGGEFHATFGTSGELMELSGQHLSIISKQGRLEVGPLRRVEGASQ